MSTLDDTLRQYTEAQLLNIAIEELEQELGVMLISFLETPVPVWPFIAAGFLVNDLLNFFGGGKPVTVDTNNVIRAYNMSAYWPLRALASDLTEMLRNGAPISDSRPAIQAQFGALKKGTVESLQQLAGGAAGESQPGFWQLFNLIELTWQYAANYPMVLQLVRLIDQMTIGLSLLAQQQSQGGGEGSQGGSGGGTGNPAPTPPWPFGPTPQPCLPVMDPNADELGAGLTCIAENGAMVSYVLWQIYQVAKRLLPPPPPAPPEVPNPPTTPPPPTTEDCCQELVQALEAIKDAISGAGAAQEPPESTPGPNLEALVAALDRLSAAIEGAQLDLSHLNAWADDAKAQLDSAFDARAALLADFQANFAQFGSQL